MLAYHSQLCPLFEAPAPTLSDMLLKVMTDIKAVIIAM